MKKNLPFRKGYNISSKLVNYAEKKKIRLDQLSKNEIIHNILPQSDFSF